MFVRDELGSMNSFTKIRPSEKVAHILLIVGKMWFPERPVAIVIGDL